MTLHSDAVGILAAWNAPDPDQDMLRVEFLRHLDRHSDGVWRSCAPGHITASTAVFDASGERVLLTLHSKLKLWLQLGGHCEPGDTSIPDAALREATEESGIGGLRLLPGPVSIDRHLVPCHPGGSYHYDVQFAAVAPEGAEPKISAESDDLRWFRADTLPDTADAPLRRLVAAAAPLLPT